MKAETTSREREAMREEVLDGLRRQPKQISSKFFYDERGSELFEDITRLPEYYLTRTERGLLERWARPWMAEVRPAAMVELGAGSAVKTRLLLEPMLALVPEPVFVPLDVSEDFLVTTAARLKEEFPTLVVRPAVADFTKALTLPDLPEPALFTFLGSTIGNFDRAGAAAFLGRVRDAMAPHDSFMMGVDLRPGQVKTVEMLEAAYNDSQGVTAEFNLNVLHVLNRELGSTFQPEAFGHHSFYNPLDGRIEMHLVSDRAQSVGFGSEWIDLDRGETIRTEISCKYDRHTVEELFQESGLVLRAWVEDEEGKYALVRAEPRTGQ